MNKSSQEEYLYKETMV